MRSPRFILRLAAALATAAFFVTASGVSTQASETQHGPPNVVLIVADDLGWTDLGCYGNEDHLTPAIDALSASGARFTEAYAAAALCAPSRASLLTGRDVLAHGIHCVNDPELGHASARLLDPPANRRRLVSALPTLAEVLRDAGYRTGCFGKWHLGHDGNRVSQWHPSARGFEEAIQTRSPSGDKRYFYPDFSTVPSVPVSDGTHLSDFVTQQAQTFLDGDDGRPFFLYLPYFSVHGPREAKAASLRAAEARGLEGRDAIHAAMCADLDAAVGALLKDLRARSLEDDTVVIFASDNGGARERGNSGLRGNKGSLYEGGIRVPMVIRWPGLTRAGAVHDAPVSLLDLFPTACEAAGARAPSGLDGLDLTPLLTGGELDRDRALCWHAPDYARFRDGAFERKPTSALRQGSLKLVYDHETRTSQLYDLASDAGEHADLAGREPEQKARMERLLQAWLKRAPELMPRTRAASGR